jgi:hypothetical protein
MSRNEQHIGKSGEQLARMYLEHLGIRQIERIGTPVTVTRSPRTGKISGAFFGEPCAADFRGVVPHYELPSGLYVGQSVMAEVKTVEHNLRWSDFQLHQPGKLSEHAELGGLSLVCWVHSTGVYILQWPIPGFTPGHGLTPEEAARLNMLEVA